MSRTRNANASAPSPGPTLQRHHRASGERGPWRQTILAHSEVVADLLRCERDLTLMLGRVRERLDAELVSVRADQTPFKNLAFEVQQALGLPATATELERLSRVLRQRTTVAHRRCTASPPGNFVSAKSNSDGQHGAMSHDPYLRRRRVIEEEFYAPPGELSPEELGTPPTPALVADDDLGDPDDDDLDDGDLGDAEQDDDLDDEDDQP